MKIPRIVFCLLFLCAAAVSARAQYCAPAEVSLVFFDENGRNISPKKLKNPKYPDKDVLQITELYGVMLSTPLEAVRVKQSDPCEVRLDSIVLQLGKKKMRLNFYVLFYTAPDIVTDQTGVRPIDLNTSGVIKVPPFENGTFEFVPAAAGKNRNWRDISPGTWKKTSDKAEK